MISNLSCQSADGTVSLLSGWFVDIVLHTGSRRATILRWSQIFRGFKTLYILMEPLTTLPGNSPQTSCIQRYWIQLKEHKLCHKSFQWLLFFWCLSYLYKSWWGNFFFQSLAVSYFCWELVGGLRVLDSTITTISSIWYIFQSSFFIYILSILVQVFSTAEEGVSTDKYRWIAVCMPRPMLSLLQVLHC